MNSIFILHENGPWVEPLRAALQARELPHTEWFMDGGQLDLSEAPPEGVFYNRMSASHHTRNHPHAADYSAAVLTWLEAHGRRVINGTSALRLEISKAAQHLALQAAGIRTPKTILAVGKAEVVAAAKRLGQTPFILKPNRGGKGLGVRRFEHIAALREYLASAEYEAPVDGVHLLQEYVPSADGSIVRAEFIGGNCYYAVRVTTGGAFELCPADVCLPGQEPGGGPRFEIEPELRPPHEAKLARLLADHGIEVAGVEYITSTHGRVYTYDINTNTNYNAAAEQAAGRSGMGRLADFLAAELAGLQPALRHSA